MIDSRLRQLCFGSVPTYIHLDVLCVEILLHVPLIVSKIWGCSYSLMPTISQQTMHLYSAASLLNLRTQSVHPFVLFVLSGGEAWWRQSSLCTSDAPHLTIHGLLPPFPSPGQIRHVPPTLSFGLLSSQVVYVWKASKGILISSKNWAFGYSP